MFGQKINLETYENKAKGFAILSAQYSKDAYFYARQNYFLSNKDHIINNCDSGLISAQMAMVFTDSALYYAQDTCVYAKLLMETVKDNQLIAFQAFNKVKKKADFQQFNEYSEVSMLRMADATADAYMVSLIIEMNDFLLGSNEKTRDFTRLESDENSYITMKTLYNNRLGDIRNELTLLDKEKRSVKENELQKLEDRIILLKEEEKKYELKVENSENKLVTVKNELSEEMLGIVNKDVFTLDKKGFYNEKVPIPTDVVIPNGLVYRIQIGFFAHQLPSAHFEGVFPISSKKIDDTYYRYEAGNFSSYKDAKAAKSSIIEKGYTDSFLIAYFNGVKIPMSQALLKEKESN
jgi:hypothetical protein